MIKRSVVFWGMGGREREEDRITKGHRKAFGGVTDIFIVLIVIISLVYMSNLMKLNIKFCTYKAVKNQTRKKIVFLCDFFFASWIIQIIN